MTSSASFGAPAPSNRGDGIGDTDLLLVSMAVLPLGLILDRPLVRTPASPDGARCAGSGALLATIEWH
jgi:hypothetical protein